MTAEIAILNKYAVALAADSAVTISRGEENQKVFNSADKLFELSQSSPIGIMVFNVLEFAETPISVLIKDFRSKTAPFSKVSLAAESLIDHLRAFSDSSPERVLAASVTRSISPLIELIFSRYSSNVSTQIENEDWLQEATKSPEAFRLALSEIFNRVVKVAERVVRQMRDATIVGNTEPLYAHLESEVHRLTTEKFNNITPDQMEAVQALSKEFIVKVQPQDDETGIVIAGYGEDEIFPSLVHIEIYGAYGPALKFVQIEEIDIDRNGDCSKVLAFAQREMAERFLYGLDDRVKSRITFYCDSTSSSIIQAIFDAINFENDAQEAALAEVAALAQREFVANLRDTGLAEIRDISQQSVEAMVEFMPKPDLAEFAEALVNLSSLQRRVSTGMETVGGPIDVAVISKSEGFVWVKRKHYFPPEINARFFKRLNNLQ